VQSPDHVVTASHTTTADSTILDRAIPFREVVIRSNRHPGTDGVGSKRIYDCDVGGRTMAIDRPDGDRSLIGH
jgi:hypothetical protein